MSASKGSTDINQQRRRLSVMSDNKLIEGIDGVNLEDEVSFYVLNYLLYCFVCFNFYIIIYICRLKQLQMLYQLHLQVDLLLILMVVILRKVMHLITLRRRIKML